MEDNKAQLAEKLKTANNVLVTVSNSPSVDQLAACIGMTIWLNKLGKHATAVFSGDVPNTLEFLEPEDTLEKNTDSLRDFIIALDKSKADKLRYKVEDRAVKIFITPYRTSLTADDLEFSQGDFNVDAIVAIGVTKQEDLDQAIVMHGRILHDAVVTTINTSKPGDIGSINWRDTTASSLCELVYELCTLLDAKQIDGQIATALLTGIVAETNRFSNDKTTPNTMSAAAALMGAGANQQLVANKLSDTLADNNSSNTTSKTKASSADKSKPADGALQIDHPEDKTEEAPEAEEPPTPEISETKDETIPIEEEPKSSEPTYSRMVTDPPTLGGQLTANSLPQDGLEPTTDPMSLPPVDTAQLLKRQPLTPITSEPQPLDIPTEQPAPGPGTLEDTPEVTSEPQPLDIPSEQPSSGTDVAEDVPPDKEEPEDEDGQTLSEIEQAVASPHLKELADQLNQAASHANANNSDQASSNLEFNPANFGLDKEDSPDAPPQVPPPIVSPNFLPPEPPPTN